DLYIADPRESREGSCYAFAHSFAETLLDRGKTWCLTHLNDTELHPELPGFRLSTRTVLATLLHGREDVIGMMVIHSPKAFAYSDEDLAIFDLLASHVATAMENCTLFAEVERLATTDPLTGLANRRHFFAVMWHAILNARRQRQPLTLLLLDLDHFKLINDTYGHQAGDRVLQRVAQTCQACVRAEDLVGRYGGEELSVLMPSTNLEGAARVAERIRHAIESLRVQFDEHEIQVTSSIGVVVETSLYNTHLDELISRADQALYAAKAAGRNCVQIWGETESRSLEQSVT
ncbi:MAG: GGDEF domain-containing protein, partial [Chloroflexia bacterium]|nr:GGDEF domain-containing protein [Chloroflexia bacterium]